MAIKNPNITKANPDASANMAFIKALYKERGGYKPTKNEMRKFEYMPVRDVVNLILGKGKAQEIWPKQTVASIPTPTPTPTPTPSLPPSPADGLQEPYKGMYEETKKLLDNLQAKGQVVAADIVITPEKVAEFMTQAQNEINPYYATEFAKAKTAFLQAQGYDQADLQNFEMDMERKYGFNQKNVAASAAERGFAQSGIRQQEEGNLAYDTQKMLETNRTNLNRRQQELAQAFAGAYGGKNTPGALNISEAPTVGVEGFIKPTKEKPLYQLSPDLYQNIIGSQEYAQTAAQKARAAQLEGAFREGEALKQNRALTI